MESLSYLVGEIIQFVYGRLQQENVYVVLKIQDPFCRVLSHLYYTEENIMERLHISSVLRMIRCSSLHQLMAN